MFHVPLIRHVQFGCSTVCECRISPFQSAGKNNNALNLFLRIFDVTPMYYNLYTAFCEEERTVSLGPKCFGPRMHRQGDVLHNITQYYTISHNNIHRCPFDVNIPNRLYLQLNKPHMTHPCYMTPCGGGLEYFHRSPCEP
jgi:hypothetical protein